MRVRATYEVIGWLFGDGQTALRQAMTKVAQAVAITPNANRTLVELVEKAAKAQNPDLPIEDFIAAAAQVAEHAALGYRDGASLSRALRELERAVRHAQYRWNDCVNCARMVLSARVRAGVACWSEAACRCWSSAAWFWPWPSWQERS